MGRISSKNILKKILGISLWVYKKIRPRKYVKENKRYRNEKNQKQEKTEENMNKADKQDS